MSLQLRQHESIQLLDDGTTNVCHPLAFATTLADNETFHYGDTMKQPDKSSFIHAMIKEVDDLSNSGVWILRKRSDIGNHKPIRAIWSFKCKRAPDGRIIKHKARLCAHGSMQVHGEHFWETYSPVVKMTTVRLMLVLSLLLGLHTRSIDFTLAFTQVPIDVETFIELPAGFSVSDTDEDYVLELKKTLYGLRQAGLNWFDTLKDHLISVGFRQSIIDPCCFIKDDLIILCYVDDCLIFCHDSSKIDSLIQNLCANLILSDEGDVAAYLGVDVSRQMIDGCPQFKLSHPHLISCIIDFLRLAASRLHDTPAEPGKALTRDTDGQPRSYNWSYRSLLGMLNYLCCTRPDILYAVHQCSKFCNDPKLSHEKAAKRIVRYLKCTPKEGIVLRPDSSKGIQCFVDADFANGWSSEDCDKPSSVYSRTGFVIMYAGCPLVWVSKLQTEVALSTTEAEYIALSQAMRELIPLLGLLEELTPALQLNKNQPAVYWKHVVMIIIMEHYQPISSKIMLGHTN
jgi:hypothetical protein